MVLLQLSDIHFRKNPNEVDEYSQMRIRTYEKLQSICRKINVDGVLICGDVAFSGTEEEYTQKAATFMNRIMEVTGCSDSQIYMVPGNHDKNWNEKGWYTRALLREGMLSSKEIEKIFPNLYMDEPETIKMLLAPFKNYIEFASKYSSASVGAKNILTDLPVTISDHLYWRAKLAEIEGYIIYLYGINSCMASDKDDERHRLSLPQMLYHIDRVKGDINISMMHHPLGWLINSGDIVTQMNKRFLVQLYGHEHIPSEEVDGTLKIFSGAYMAPQNEVQKNEKCNPLFNIIDLDVKGDELKVQITPYQWKWTDEDDGYFEEKETKPYSLKINDSNAAVYPKEKQLSLPKGLRERDIEIKWINYPYNENVVKKMYPDFEIKHNFLLDSTEFFRRLRADDRYQELYELLK